MGLALSVVPPGLGSSGPLQVCGCPASFERQLASADVILRGTAADGDVLDSLLDFAWMFWPYGDPRPLSTVELRVTTVWRGPVMPTVRIRKAVSGGCGSLPDEGDDVVVAAHHGVGGLEVQDCAIEWLASDTGPSEVGRRWANPEAATILRELGPGVVPPDVGVLRALDAVVGMRGSRILLGLLALAWAYGRFQRGRRRLSAEIGYGLGRRYGRRAGIVSVGAFWTAWWAILNMDQVVPLADYLRASPSAFIDLAVFLAFVLASVVVASALLGSVLGVVFGGAAGVFGGSHLVSPASIRLGAGVGALVGFVAVWALYGTVFPSPAFAVGVVCGVAGGTYWGVNVIRTARSHTASPVV
jgi:hypothetical protein